MFKSKDKEDQFYPLNHLIVKKLDVLQSRMGSKYLVVFALYASNNWVHCLKSTTDCCLLINQEGDVLTQDDIAGMEFKIVDHLVPCSS